MRILIYIGIVFLAASCAGKQPKLQTGDLLFQVSAESAMSGAITAATGSDEGPDFSHVGIFIKTDSADLVLEATTRGGVKLSAMNEFLNRSQHMEIHMHNRPLVVAMRLKDTTGLSASVSRALERIGLPYDYSYLPDNGKYYCTELVWESYCTPDGTPIFTARPMNFRAADGSMPQFWIELFAELNEPIPEGVPGTNPNDMAKAPALVEIYRFFN